MEPACPSAAPRLDRAFAGTCVWRRWRASWRSTPGTGRKRSADCRAPANAGCPCRCPGSGRARCIPDMLNADICNARLRAGPHALVGPRLESAEGGSQSKPSVFDLTPQHPGFVFLAQVPDAALASLQEVCQTNHREATRALRFCGGDVAAAVDFVTQERAKREVGGRGGGRGRPSGCRRASAWIGTSCVGAQDGSSCLGSGSLDSC